MYYVYVLKSCVAERFYKGFTENLAKRIIEHNEGRTPSTKAYLPWRLVYYEVYEDKKEALKREKFFKTGVGRNFIKTQIAKAPVFNCPPKAEDFGSED